MKRMGKKQNLDRMSIHFRPLTERKNKVLIKKDAILPGMVINNLPESIRVECKSAAENILESTRKNSSVICAFGAHTIKNGLGPILIEMMKNGWLSHLATNGAGVIHDWEIAFQGETSEDVAHNVAKGEFGIWQETGFYINLALISGAFEGLGYGESVGAMISRDGLEIPREEELLSTVDDNKVKNPGKAAAALDFLNCIHTFNIQPGFMEIKHPYKQYSIQAAAFDLGINFTSHPMFGHDIIYTHPANNGAAVGRTAEQDFLRFAGSISNLEGGVYLSVGSAVMSPMIFEKSLSMARNIAIAKGEMITNFQIYVVDLAESAWNWETGEEPPMNDPSYYLRYCKTFSRMGGHMHYLTADNALFFPALYNSLVSESYR